MAYIKTTNNITEETTHDIIRTVQCPYCKTYMKHVQKYITAMKCWSCDKEFRIQQDIDKLLSIPSDTDRGKHTVLRGIIE